jgi:hypothetical protein
VLYDAVVEVDERVVLKQDGAEGTEGTPEVAGGTGEILLVEKVRIVRERKTRSG